jgi:predicted TIM-barrel fold metal-dependent hydrolase
MKAPTMDMLDSNAHTATLAAVDTHAHVFAKGLNLARSRRYAPEYDATLDTFLRHLDAHRVGHAVLVQPSFLGTDNTYLLDALDRCPDRLRGVAVVLEDLPAHAMREMQAQGIAGVRLNLVGQPLPDLASPGFKAFLRKVADLGWHVELHKEAKDLAPLIEAVLGIGARVVVDHFGRPDPAQGTSDPHFKSLLRFADSERVWVKPSAAYRSAQAGPALSRGAGLARDATAQLVSAFGAQRLMWGSDWPHTQFERVTDYPQALSAFTQLGLAPAVAEAVLCTTPNAFYGFPATTSSCRQSRPSFQPSGEH